MSTTAAQAQDTRHTGQQSAEATPSLLRGLLRLVFWLFVALLFSILVEWVGMVFWKDYFRVRSTEKWVT